MEIKSIKYNKLSVIFHFLIVIIIWVLLLILMFKTSKIGGVLFILIFSTLLLLPSIIFVNNFIKLNEDINEIIISENLKINSLKMSFKYSDIEQIYPYYSSGGIFIILKLKDFKKYENELKKTILGRIQLLNFRILGKSKIFINLRFVDIEENELLKLINNKCQ
ncbi:hypothetical protein [Flavobacterium sp.]|uniref:hypothetical protein n=1 Tax=Flavobacterium sp. TaxID=239 RepID=UPI0008D41C80|nr:hypothetical protein [Flavobacterium sp.]OGS61940.1 MAG: hypothetical protein A2X07_04250 [Flavobacteria bacterium GWF1_32_7]HBD26631.1 hypothetical protein [Flavobacterium sp.]